MGNGSANRRAAVTKKNSKASRADATLGEGEIEAQTTRTPVLLRFFQATNALLAAGDDDLTKRHRVMAHLIQKIISLNSAIAVLDAQLATTTDPPTYAAIALELVEARAERDLCQARSQAINASQPFQNPGPAAEASLAAAISAVDQSAANTAAITNLMAAVHGLVASYAAGTT